MIALADQMAEERSAHFGTQDADYGSVNFSEVYLMQPTQMNRFHNSTTVFLSLTSNK